jgi:Flp pilus assembly protein TadG
MNNPNFFQLQNKMRLLFNISAIFKSEKGVAAVYVALLISVFIGFAALAIDIGYLMVTKNELQNAADSSALAGACNLSSNNYNSIYAAANNVAVKNKVSGNTISASQIVVSTGTWTAPTFTSDPSLYGAVAVNVYTNGPITRFFWTGTAVNLSANSVAVNVTASTSQLVK